MDKEGEQTPAGGIDLGGKPTVSEEKLPFVQAEQRVAWRELFKPSQSTHCKTSFGLLPCNSLKRGHPFFLRLRGGDDVTTIVVQWGACAEPAGQFWRELFKF